MKRSRVNKSKRNNRKRTKRSMRKNMRGGMMTNGLMSVPYSDIPSGILKGLKEHYIYDDAKEIIYLPQEEMDEIIAFGSR